MPAREPLGHLLATFTTILVAPQGARVTTALMLPRTGFEAGHLVAVEGVAAAGAGMSALHASAAHHIASPQGSFLEVICLHHACEGLRVLGALQFQGGAHDAPGDRVFLDAAPHLRVLGEVREISQDIHAVLGPGQGNVDAVLVLDEPDAFVLAMAAGGAAHKGQDHDLELFALNVVHRGDLADTMDK